MDLLATAQQLLSDKLGINIDPSQLTGALQGLMGDNAGNFNIGDLVSKFSANGGMQNALKSWLGDGANTGISASNITDMFGADKVGEFANKVGVNAQEAAGGLADVVPQLIDKASNGGSLLDNLGNLGGDLGGKAGGLADMAKGFFK